MLKRSTLSLATGVAIVAGLALYYAGSNTGPGELSTPSLPVTVETAAGTLPAVEVWKSPTCGCCEEWIRYLESSGYPVIAHDSDDMNSVKARLGIPGPELASCHTATIDGYVIEGHVPLSDIERLLAERPDVVGISAPGMPMQSPGMGSEDPRDYDVLSFDTDGQQAIFSRH